MARVQARARCGVTGFSATACPLTVISPRSVRERESSMRDGLQSDPAALNILHHYRPKSDTPCNKAIAPNRKRLNVEFASQVGNLRAGAEEAGTFSSDFHFANSHPIRVPRDLLSDRSLPGRPSVPGKHGGETGESESRSHKASRGQRTGLQRVGELEG